MIIRALKPKDQEKAMSWLQASALLAFCIGILLPKIFIDRMAVSLISGMLLGYSIVGNLFSLYYHTRRREKLS